MTAASEVAAWLPRPDPHAHKDTWGRVMVVGQSLRYSGAPLMSAMAAARTGAGVVVLAAPRALVLALAGRAPELVYLPLDESTPGIVDSSAARQVADGLAAGHISALVIGPGGVEEGAGPAFVLGVLARARVTTVIDAGALNVLSATPDWTVRLPPRAVLTPHPGEARRLAGAEVGQDPVAWTREHARSWDRVVVLKGACTVVASQSGDAFVHDRPNAALATAGTGDALAGCIGALAANGLEPYRAACAGVLVHGEAGALVAREVGPRGALATDLIARLPRALASLAA